MEDELSKEIFTCMDCQKQFDCTQGTWPQKYAVSGEYNLDADNNNRSGSEFVCYDCLG